MYNPLFRQLFGEVLARLVLEDCLSQSQIRATRACSKGVYDSHFRAIRVGVLDLLEEDSGGSHLPEVEESEAESETRAQRAYGSTA